MSKLQVVGCVLLVLAGAAFCSLDGPASAQDPVGGAVATLAAATANAQAAQWQAAQAATRQAQVQEAAAAATAQAMGATATSQAIDAAATQQAYGAAIGATATRQVEDVQAAATRQAIEADATRQAYEVALEEIRRRSDFGTALLYAAGLAALAAVVWIVFAAALAWVRRLSDMAVTQRGRGAPTQVEIIVPDEPPPDEPPVLLLQPGPATMPEARVIDDPRAEQAMREWFYGTE